ncbi:hypothetical protein AGLY_012134 [Aphis glycines]|uniref:Uncharacterized protein n=1 Tax=Aphis glycines TaxID=307491 RepID=A0A6G0T9K5_APHGL|nr:hypothetical protein AGLY_012134 [Aphis glycines]
MYIGSASLVVAIASQLDTDTFAFYLTTERRGVKTRYFRFCFFFADTMDAFVRTSRSGHADRIPAAKASAAFVVFLFSFVCGVLPLKLADRWPLTAEYTTRISRKPTVASLMLCFGAGVLLFTALVHLQPDVRQSVRGLQAAGRLPDTDHFGDLIFCIGFFAAFAIYETMNRKVRGRDRRTADVAGQPPAGVVPLQPVRRRAGAVVARHVPGIFRRYAAARPRRRVARVRRAGREQADRRVLSGPRAGLVRCPENRGGRVLRAVRRGHARRGGGRHGALPVLFPGHRRPVARHRGGLLAGAGRRLAGVRRVLRRVAQTEAVRHDAHAVHRRRVQRHATVTDRHS